MNGVEIVVVFRSQEDAPAALPEAAVPNAGTQAFLRQLRPLFSPIPGVESAAVPAAPEAQSTADEMRRYFVATTAPEQADALIHDLIAVPNVETAYAKPAAENPLAPGAAPTMLEAAPQGPTIPDFSDYQGYLDPAPGGVDARFAWQFAGGDGAGVTIIDVEGGWQLSHVDLAVNSAGLLGGTQYPEVSWRNHGTAVLAEMGGDRNDFGVVGIAHGAVIGTVSHGTIGSAKAIQLAAQKLKAGDIILLEMHRPGPRTNFQSDPGQQGYIGVEWWPDDLLAIQYAVQKGLIVVEAAGNGAENLDDAIYDTPARGFPANWKNPFRDARISGAIVVGAGAPPSGQFGPDRSRLDFSNFGTRVDCQGWGRGVVTAGYGDLFRLSGVPDDEDSWFTATFSGTSSASPIVAGTLACVQGIARAQGQTLSPAALRQALLETGSPQVPNGNQRIGRRPDLRQLVARLLPGISPHPTYIAANAGGAPEAPTTAPVQGATHREPSLSIAFLGDPSDHEVTSTGNVENLQNMLRGWRKERLCPPGSVAGVNEEVAIGRDDSLEAAFLELLAARRHAVGIIRTEGINHEGINGSWSGTGFMVSPNLLLTNHHVLNSAAVASAAEVAFDYELSAQLVASGRKGFATAGRTYTLRPDKVFITSPFKGGLDYTFVWIDDVALPEGALIRMERAAFAIERNERAFIIHHPNGAPKRVSLDDADIVAARPDSALIHYTSDTEPGSSGAPVFDRSARLVALHHASRNNDEKLTNADGLVTDYVNEGIKVSAIALDLESRCTPETSAMISVVLAEIHGTDTLAGFFGSAGRTVDLAQPGAELVVDVYKATNQDIDIGFWNIEWFANRFEDKMDEVATMIVDMGLDIWALAETSPAATAALVETIKRKFGLQLACLHSEPQASASKQSTSIVWNPKTVQGQRIAWPAEIENMLQLRIEDLSPAGEKAPDSGKIFDRYPGLFFFQGRDGTGGNINFYLVPLHLKAMSDGWARRRAASQILAKAVATMIEVHKADGDWVLGGDFNAELSSGDFDALRQAAFMPLSAQDEADGALSYLKSPHSLIDHVFLSPNMSRLYGAKDFFILAQEKSQLDYLKRFSDHRPVLVRLAAHAAMGGAAELSRRPDPVLDALLTDMLRGQHA